MVKQVKLKKKNKYPSAEFLYGTALEDYNRSLSNYDRIYDRVNIALAVCCTLLLATLNNIDLKLLFNFCAYAIDKKMLVAVYGLLAISSAVMLIIATIQLLLLSRSRKVLSFDSNSIKDEALYEEEVEDAALWVTLQYIRAINDVWAQVKEKQTKLNRSLLLLIIALLLYAASVLICNGGLK